METALLKRFAQTARTRLLSIVDTKINWSLAEGSTARRLYPESVAALSREIEKKGRDAVVDQVAYFWFNRLCALRFMDVNGYTETGIVSPAEEGGNIPAVLEDAMQGMFDYDVIPEEVQNRVTGILNGVETSSDPQADAYRLLLVSSCNYWAGKMPFLFQKVNDYTELLLPDDLLSSDSLLASLREAMTEEACKDVEVIGWLYQYYITERREEVISVTKAMAKLTPETLPAATQLFTPHWIVRFIVDNTLGRLWMLNHPESELKKHMDFYIKPDEEDVENDVLEIESPEEIKVIDCCVGSGHMLTYAYDLLFEIYSELGYSKTDIPELILQNNLYGTEIDERAGELAAFALMMKARSHNRRLFDKKAARPNICVLKNIHFSKSEIDDYERLMGIDALSPVGSDYLNGFEEADNFGSLIQCEIEGIEALRNEVMEKIPDDMFHIELRAKVLQVLNQYEYLSTRYSLCVTNPPYAAKKNINSSLASYVESNFKEFKNDLYSAFIKRASLLCLEKGYIGLMTPMIWMFIKSYESLRRFLISEKTIHNLVQLEYSSFEGATVPICAFTIRNCKNEKQRAKFIRLENFRGAYLQAPKTIEAIKNESCGWLYKKHPNLFNNIKGSPIAYWLSDQILELFRTSVEFSKKMTISHGLTTTNNNYFMRFWPEVSVENIGFSCPNAEEALKTGKKWFPYNKGGARRKWYGNHEYVVNWESDGELIKNTILERYPYLNGNYGFVVTNERDYFKESISWSKITSGITSFRYYPEGFIPDVSGMTITRCEDFILPLVNTRLYSYISKAINPTINLEVGDVAKFPYVKIEDKNIILNSKKAINIAKADWDSQETSWNFSVNPLLNFVNTDGAKIENLVSNFKAYWKNQANELLKLEIDNNQIISALTNTSIQEFGACRIEDITLFNNISFRYLNQEEPEKLWTHDLICDLISYSVGCMFGRYSIDKNGIILGKQNSNLQDYYYQIRKPRFNPDADNCIPIFDEDWFADDIVTRFREFVRVTFGEEYYVENMAYIERTLNVKNKKGWTIRDYFAKDFYEDHVKRYRKRPIYWLFTSPKGSFKCLIYLHRYNRSTVSTVLNSYLRNFMQKLQTFIEIAEKTLDNPQAAARDQSVAMKNKAKYGKMLDELRAYERDVLYPLAQESIELDLDDGVKVNYLKFGSALKKIPGLAGKDE